MSGAKITPLHGWHVARGAKMAEFAGYDMPIEYVGVLAEHETVRTRVGVFDVSHMGKIRVRGSALQWLNGLLTNDLNLIENNKAQYSMLLNDEGGVIDDLLVYLISEDDIWLIPNASNAQRVFNVLQQHKNDEVALENHHNEYCIFAIQGPESSKALEHLGLNSEIEYMSAGWQLFESTEVLVCRSGYTGEQGFELICPNSAAETLWSTIISSNVEPIGLGARDTLRLEMGYPLHGNDISESITPLEAGLKWAIGNSKPTYLGKSALESKDTKRKRIALKLIDRGIPRGHMNVSSSGSQIGETTSGGYSPSLKVGIALALVDRNFNETSVEIDIRGKLIRAEVVKLPFVSSSAR
ncbi:MAG: glycine cleavage system aminomethyltransferase GcvT [Candidatus Nanopelagicales bacterium]